jgi:hypothetical protein
MIGFSPIRRFSRVERRYVAKTVRSNNGRTVMTRGLELAMASCFSSLGVLIAFVPAATVQAAPVQNVSVVNPTTSPVNARITNSVVPVEVSNAAPIPVTVNQAAEEVVQVFMAADFEPFNIRTVCNLYTVPAGKRLMVDYVSGYFFGPLVDVDSIYRARLFRGDGFRIELNGQKKNATSTDGSFTVSQPVTFYVEAGQTVQMLFHFADQFVGDVGECTLLGRLVNAPAP